MAFVYKSEKTKPPQENFEGLGPGRYLGHQNYKFKENSVGFLSTTEKMPGPKPNKKKESPPIDLALTTNFANPQMNILNMELCESKPKKNPIQTKGQNSVFKSITKRFISERKSEDFPGPGAYNNLIIGNNNEFRNARNKGNRKENSIIDEIMQKENYQPIPSIPTNLLGYAEFDNGFIKPNKLSPQENKEGPGPGSYELKGFLDMRRNKVY